MRHYESKVSCPRCFTTLRKKNAGFVYCACDVFSVSHILVKMVRKDISSTNHQQHRCLFLHLVFHM